jgi:cyclophilin family peptidyl-prolyl cis-trans isomerase
MNAPVLFRHSFIVFALALSALAGPVIDPLGNVSIPMGKSLIISVTATSPNGRPLIFTATSSTNRIVVQVHTNDPFWKMTVVQAAPALAPGAFPTPFRGGVVTVTNLGDMTFMLFRDIAPHTVDVVQGLTAGGLYNSNTIFHRVIAGFMDQGGDPLTNGLGGPVFRYDDEFNPQAIFSGNGQLALANSGKDTDGSQFFVTVAPFRSGDFDYTIFGQLLRGFNVLSNINNTATDANNRPLADVIITRASIVPDNFDTVLTLIGTNLAGVVGTIKVIADDGAGGRATNLFTATTASDAINDPPFLNTPAITNLIIPINGSVTNVLSAFDVEGNVVNYGFQKYSFNAVNYTTVTSFNSTTGRFIITPVPGFYGPFTYSFAVSPNSGFSPFDSQVVTFAVGDTSITALGTDFVTPPLVLFSNLLVATFTNGVPNSAATNFIALINWGDNSTSNGQIVTNLALKEVLGAHTYTNAGTYPVYVTIQSYLGASATAVSTASVPPSIRLTTAGTNNILTWPAWAADYQLQSATNLPAASWQVVSNFPILAGYNNVVTNGVTNGGLFYRLKK